MSYGTEININMLKNYERVQTIHYSFNSRLFWTIKLEETEWWPVKIAVNMKEVIYRKQRDELEVVCRIVQRVPHSTCFLYNASMLYAMMLWTSPLFPYMAHGWQLLKSVQTLCNLLIESFRSDFNTC
jgi:hypothetical protein